MNQILDYIAVIALVINILVSFKSIEKGILIALLVKPIIDTAWDFNRGVLSMIDIHAVLFLVLGYLLIVRQNLLHKIGNPLIVAWILAHLGLIFGLIQFPSNSFDGFIRMSFLPLGFLLLPYFWFNPDTKAILIKILLFGGLFASSIILLQSSGLLPTETIRVTKGLVRMNGYYHDIVTSRMYILQGLLALFIVYKLNVLKISSYVQLLILAIFLVAGFFLYSKAFTGIIFIGLFLFMLTQRKTGILLLGPLLVIPVFLFFSDTISSTIERMFVTEIQYNEVGNGNSDRLFSGRGSVWDHYISEFNRSDVLTQFIGINKNDGRTHSEFLRILILSGFVGFFSYIGFLILLIGKTIISFKNSLELSFISLWMISIMIIDGISVTWGLYPQYLIIFFGLMIISFQSQQTFVSQIK